jgi:hypothetical protein
MSLISLVLVLVCIALTVFGTLDVLRQQQAVQQLEMDVERYRAWNAERQRFLATRERLASGSDLLGTVVEAPTSITRASHEAIAAIPFTVLESIPVTAETTKLVRGIHDEIADTVYDIISDTTRGIAGIIRRGLTGPTPPAPPDEPEK